MIKSDKGEKKMSRKSSIISVINQKGGVGKTTTAINLCSSLGIMEQSTLLVDIDPQSNSSSGLGIDTRNLDKTVYDLLLDQASFEEVVVKSDYPNLSILPSSINLVGAEIEMVNLPNREKIMKRVIEKIRNDYDYVLIDCSPSLGLITVNALSAADSVIIPVQCEYFALEGLGKLLNTIKFIQTRLNTALEIEGFLLTMYDARLRLSNQVVDEVTKHFQQMVFKTLIQRNIKLSESPSFGKPVILYDANSTGAINYLNMAKELLQKNDHTAIKNSQKVVN